MTYEKKKTKRPMDRQMEKQFRESKLHNPKSNTAASEASPKPVDTPPPPSQELSMIQKVKISNNLTSALDNQQFVETVRSLASGDYILRLLTNAIEKELERLFNGEVQALPVEVASLASIMKTTGDSINHFQSVITAFHQTPLVETLWKLAGIPKLQETVSKFPTPPGLHAQPAAQVNNQGQPLRNPHVSEQAMQRSLAEREEALMRSLADTGLTF